MKKRWRKVLLLVLAALAAALLAVYLLQRFWAHRDGAFVPDYPRAVLTEDTDDETLFLQTGLGPSAAARLRNAGNFQTILDIQDAFFDPPEIDCVPLLGWFTREDRLAEGSGPPLVDLQPGDVVLTLSTHSFGWRHGHAGLAIDAETALESVVIGTDSKLMRAEHWGVYSCVAVLRLKDVTPALQRQVTDYALEELTGIPYHLTAGFFGPKAPDPDDGQFGLHCSYLVWYAWNHLGYDLDSDGGRLVSTTDLLRSDLLEVVQIYGMDPREFLGEGGSETRSAG